MSTQTISIYLPDGAVREVPAGTTPLEIANSISPRLAAASVVARLTPVTGTANESHVSDGDFGGGSNVCRRGLRRTAPGGFGHSADCRHTSGAGQGEMTLRR